MKDAEQLVAATGHQMQGAVDGDVDPALSVQQGIEMKFKFIEKGGWDKMPGQEKADYGVSRACVDGLELLFDK